MERVAYIQATIRNPFVAQMFVRSATEMWVSAFNTLKMSNKLDKNKTLVFLKALGLRILRYGNDSCRSSLQLMTSLIQIDWERDLFTPEEKRNALVAAERCEPSYLETEPRFRQLVSQWSDDGSAWSYAIAGKGQARISCNDKFVNTFLSGADEIDQINEDHMQPAFFWSRVLAPEDQPHFYTLVCDVACKSGTGAVGSQFVAKCIDKDGLEFRAKIRYRALFLERGRDVLVGFAVTPLEPSAPDPCQLIPKNDIDQRLGTREAEASSADDSSSSTQEHPRIKEEDYRLPSSFHYSLTGKRPREPTPYKATAFLHGGHTPNPPSSSDNPHRPPHSMGAMAMPTQDTTPSPGHPAHPYIPSGLVRDYSMSRPPGPPPSEGRYSSTHHPSSIPPPHTEVHTYYSPYVPIYPYDFPSAAMMMSGMNMPPPSNPYAPHQAQAAMVLGSEGPARQWNSVRWMEGSSSVGGVGPSALPTPPPPPPPPMQAPDPRRAPPIPPPRGPPASGGRPGTEPRVNPDGSLVTDADILKQLFLDS